MYVALKYSRNFVSLLLTLLRVDIHIFFYTAAFSNTRFLFLSRPKTSLMEAVAFMPEQSFVKEADQIAS